MSKSRARNAKGRFVKGSSRKSTAIVRRTTSAPVRRRKASGAIVRRGVRRGRRRSGGGGGGMVSQLKAMAPELIAQSVYGYATRAPAQDAKGADTMAGKIREYLAKVPTWDVIGAPASHGALFLFLSTQVSGKARRALALMSKAALHRAFDNLGSSGFDHEAAAHLAGDDVYLEGALDADDE